MPRAYKFYEADPVLCEILDELVRDRQLTPTIHNLLLNGLGKDITKTRSTLKKRIETINKVDRLYRGLQTRRENKKEMVYAKYKKYRNQLTANGMAYDHADGLEWIVKKADKLNMNVKKLLTEFEEKYGGEKK